MADRIIYKGETAVLRELVLDQDGVVKNLAGGTVDFRIGNERSGEFEFEKAGSLTSDGSDGLIQVDLTIANTNSLEGGREWDYQFIVTDVDGDVQVVTDRVVDVREILPAT